MSECTLAYEDDYVKAEIEMKEGLPFFHTEVKKALDKKAVKVAREAFTHIKQSLLDMGYERLYAYTPSPHFARLIGPGFINIQTVPSEDGTYEVIVWELKQQSL